jgi:hypothetical protein
MTLGRLLDVLEGTQKAVVDLCCRPEHEGYFWKAISFGSVPA